MVYSSVRKTTSDTSASPDRCDGLNWSEPRFLRTSLTLRRVYEMLWNVLADLSFAWQERVVRKGQESLGQRAENERTVANTGEQDKPVEENPVPEPLDPRVPMYRQLTS